MALRPLVAALVLLPLLLVVAGALAPRGAGSPSPEATGTAAPAPGSRLEIAESFAASDESANRTLVRTLASEPTVAGHEARVLAGLLAHAEGRSEDARALLSAEAPAPLEDWRLFTLAEELALAGDTEAAVARHVELLDRFPGSPLAAAALERAARTALAGDAGDLAAALVGRGRAMGASGELGASLEAIAWELGAEPGREELRRSAALRLLIDFPLTASKLEVVETFRHPDGTVEWSRLFNPDQLERRARNLLDLGIEGGALTTLGFVDEADRGDGWKRLEAEALIALRRGGEALEGLAGTTADEPAAAARLEWLRGRAALDAAALVSGRRNLPSAERRAMRDLGRAHLGRVASLDADPDLTLAALRRLYRAVTEPEEEEEIERGLEILRRLKHLDPYDVTGAAHLWKVGWREYERRNLSGAIGTWGELHELYPETSYGRAALYWMGRAHERLGQPERARQIFLEVTRPEFDDLYRRHARARLGPQPAPATGTPAAVRPAAVWPRDPRLERAELLSLLGLHGSALTELEGLAGSVDRRAAAALEAVALVGAGRRRESIERLRRAFPELGTPRQLEAPVEALRMYYPLDYRQVVERYAAAHGLPRELVFGMIRQESAFDARALSHAGARGLMQLMPSTGRELAGRLGLPFSTARLEDPEFSVRLGTLYLRQVLGMFDGRQELALAAYNAGPTRIRRLWGRAGGSAAELDRFFEGLAYSETRTYVQRVVLYSETYRRLYPEL